MGIIRYTGNMYLEKLEIQGFKSFAQKTTLTFPDQGKGDAHGMTAIVGPNGSGKSNIADAVRWALGEQSLKTLRGKKSEDVIFAGSDKKGKLGMAEVSLHFNNEDKRAAIDYSQFILTRRLYRDGESDYLINGSKVRLMDIELLLAKANVGQKSYSVVGQGTVEGFLNTSLADRKEFFDEATGVKQFQIKRDDALNKLRASLEHLSQAEMLLNEIEPRLAQLTRQVNRLKKRGELESELRELQLAYYRTVWHEVNDRFRGANEKFLDMEKNQQLREKKLAALTSELSGLQRQSGADQEFERLQAELSARQSEKEKLTAEMAKLDARFEMKLESEGKFEAAFFTRRQAELERETLRLKDEISALEKESAEHAREAERREVERNRLTDEIERLHQSLGDNEEMSSDARFEELKTRLRASLDMLETAERLDDIEGIKAALRAIRKELTELHALAGGFGSSASKQAQSALISLTQQKETVLEELRLSNQAQTIASERLRLARTTAAEVAKETASVTARLEADGGRVAPSPEERIEVDKQLAVVEKAIAILREKIGGFTAEQEVQRQRLFSLQNSLQILQGELNRLNQELNDTKVEAARQETRLEDLENAIRQDLGGLKEVRDLRQEHDIDRFAVQEKITSLKRQLELIGGIDPEIESEFITTKERYDFLSGQVDDLLTTGQSLEEVISELDITIKERFDKEFKIISQKFQEYFKILFSGGTASIVKVMTEEMPDEQAPKGGEENKEETEITTIAAGKLKRIKFLQKYNATGLAGIEIQATPPGKKIKSIGLLSGGERALTAIALICAIISANPSPFVLLDEVDAALDEANTERLAKILDDLSHKTQFIVITHNRASMVRATVLYGVTMQDDGVSKLLSIKLEDADHRNR